MASFDFKLNIPSPFVHTRNSVMRVRNWENRLITVAANEAAFVGSRTVENLATAVTTHSVTVVSGLKYQVSITGDDGATCTLSGAAVDTLTADGVNQISFDDGTAITASSTTLTLTISGTLTGVLVEKVQGQSNQNPSSIIAVSSTASYDTLNANTVDANGVVTERVGCKIDQRKLFNGSSNYATVPTITLNSGDFVELTAILGASASGNDYLLTGSVGGQTFVFVTTTTGAISKSAGITSYVDGVASSTWPLDGLPHTLRLEYTSTLDIAYVGIRLGLDSWWSGSISNININNERFYKLDELTGTTAVNSANPGTNDGTYVNMSDPLPLLDPVMLGVRLDEERENLALHNRDMTDAVWTATSITPTLVAGIGIDGGTGSRITASAANGTIFQSVTDASAARTYSAHIRRQAGTGTIEMTMDGGSTYTDITSLINANTHTRIDIQQTLANPSIGFRIVTNTDAVDVDFSQLEEGYYPTSEIETGASSSTRVASLLTANVSHPRNGVTYAVEWTSAYDHNVFKDYDGTTNPAIVSAQGATAADLFELSADHANDDFFLQKIATDAGSDSVSEADLGSYSFGDGLSATMIASNVKLGLTINTEGEETSTGANAIAGWPTNQLTDITIGSRKDGSRPTSMTISSFSYTFDGVFINDPNYKLVSFWLRGAVRRRWIYVG